jgi:hypothetical protein
MPRFLVLLIIVFISSSFTTEQPNRMASETLQDKYVEALIGYEGQNYAPYGEKDGISCSTLVRQSMIDVLEEPLANEIKTNPCPSEELNKGCNNKLSLILHAENIKKIDYSKLQKGDIVVITSNNLGIHSMAYLGDETWIHADPITEKVVIINQIDEKDDWIDFQVNVMRWNILKKQ